MPTRMVATLVSLPLTSIAPGLGRFWAVVLWPFTLPLGLILGAVHATTAAPLVGMAVAAVWWGARRVPARWSEGRVRVVLVAGGAVAFGSAGVARGLLTAFWTSGVQTATPSVGDLDPPVLPFAVLGAVAGACLAEGRVRSRAAR